MSEQEDNFADDSAKKIRRVPLTEPQQVRISKIYSSIEEDDALAWAVLNVRAVDRLVVKTGIEGLEAKYGLGQTEEGGDD